MRAVAKGQADVGGPRAGGGSLESHGGPSVVSPPSNATVMTKGSITAVAGNGSITGPSAVRQLGQSISEAGAEGSEFEPRSASLMRLSPFGVQIMSSAAAADARVPAGAAAAIIDGRTI